MSVHLRVLRLGLFPDGDVRVGVLPEGEEVRVGGAGFGWVALKRPGPGEAETRPPFTSREANTVVLVNRRD
jgi:hypothetical protein